MPFVTFCLTFISFASHLYLLFLRQNLSIPNIKWKNDHFQVSPVPPLLSFFTSRPGALNKLLPICKVDCSFACAHESKSKKTGAKFFVRRKHFHSLFLYLLYFTAHLFCFRHQIAPKYEKFSTDIILPISPVSARSFHLSFAFLR